MMLKNKFIYDSDLDAYVTKLYCLSKNSYNMMKQQPQTGKH
jgi:hypothetical protein